MEKYFSTFDVAKMCHVSPSSVIRWIREGRLHASTTVGGHNRICGEDVVSLLETLRLPIPNELTANSPQNESEMKDEGPARVLIVDDDPEICRFFQLFFKRNYSPFLIEFAHEGFKAGWIAHAFRPHVVLLDLMMPGLDGFSACELIRQFPELNHTQIIAMTGYGAQHRDRALSLGANGYLEKPFSEETLRLLIQKHLEVAGISKACYEE